MVKVSYQGQTLAESNDTIVVEGNHYFPPDSLVNKDSVFKASTSQGTTTCPWKGTAHYYDVTLPDKTIAGSAWYYPSPKDAASNIKDYVAFYKTKGFTFE